MTILAAGAICWRIENSELKVALIHRARYDDWSWPKGKVDPGECLPETAVREIAEETGLRIKLGLRIGVQKYNLPSGVPKEVHYWASKISEKALLKSKFKPSEEVSQVVWMSAESAASRLTYSHDGDPLRRLIELHEANQLDTKPFIILRHAKATPRSDWKGENGKRPLLALGKTQAKTLVPLISAFPVKRVVSSPWVRCLKTVEPYAAGRKMKVILRSQLSELGSARGPQRTQKVVRDLVEDNLATLVCTHRPALPSILDALSNYADAGHEIAIHEARALRPGHMMVVHLSTEIVEPVDSIAIEKVHSKVPAKPVLKRRVVAVETYAPVIE